MAGQNVKSQAGASPCNDVARARDEAVTPLRAVDDLLQHTAWLRRLARELVGDAGADDVLQDAAIEMMRAPPARPGPALGWLVAVVRNLARKRRRGERVRVRHEQQAARA